jgi:hypothetical protein
MDFVATKDFVTPYVVSTGMPHKPTRICKKKFKKGEIITGEIKTANGKPAFVLHKGVMVVPLAVVKQVITRDLQVSNAVGDNVAKSNPKVEVRLGATKKDTDKQYIDALVIGAIVGFAGIIIAEKQGWIANIDKKNRLYGAIGGAILGAYIVYRKK